MIESYTYYRDGSMRTKTAGGVTTTYTYDANNRMLTETEGSTTKTYTYDANGNQLTGDGATYTYNARGQQSGYSKGGVTASYTYLPTGLRKSKTVGITTTNYVWDGQNMVYEYDGTNSTGGTAYYYGLTLISQGNYAYYLYNAHGDVVQLISSTGLLGLSYNYDAFGNELTLRASDSNPFRYAGQYYDKETGTYYLRARYYDPSVGRFTQQDGWQFADPNDPLSLNLYTYCYGNPVVFIDFTGNWPTWSQIASAAFIVAISAVSVAAIVVTAGAAGAAIGTGVAMYIGASASTAAAITTVATVGAYGVATGVAAVGMSDAGEVLTGHNVIRDDIMGGNQAAYDNVKLALGLFGDAIAQTGASFSYVKTNQSRKNWTVDDIQFSEKFTKNEYKNQPQKRGWTTEMILSAVNNPVKTGTAVNKYTGNSVTAYYIDSVHYVAIDDVTKKIIQVADMNKPNWRFDLSK